MAASSISLISSDPPEEAPAALPPEAAEAPEALGSFFTSVDEALLLGVEDVLEVPEAETDGSSLTFTGVDDFSDFSDLTSFDEGGPSPSFFFSPSIITADFFSFLRLFRGCASSRTISRKIF